MKPPRILVIAGSDSSGGAGIQADIKTVTMLGGYAMTAITAVTAQNTTGVSAVEALSPDMVAAQIDACLSDIGADAVKIGMLGSPAIAHVVADRLEGLAAPVVFDPVMVATSGAVLADEATVAAFERLMALATLTTPNVPELAVLSGSREIADGGDEVGAVEQILRATGAKRILVKGGHRQGNGWTIYANGSEIAGLSDHLDSLIFDCLYFLDPAGNIDWLDFFHSRIDTRHTHGTGCTLASAIATHLGVGLPLERAIELAREFVRAALLAAPGFGAGHGPMGHQMVR